MILWGQQMMLTFLLLREQFRSGGARPCSPHMPHAASFAQGRAPPRPSCAVPVRVHPLALVRKFDSAAAMEGQCRMNALCVHGICLCFCCTMGTSVCKGWGCVVRVMGGTACCGRGPVAFAGGGWRGGRRRGPRVTRSLRSAGASRKASEMRVECRKRETCLDALCLSVLVQPFATCCPALKSRLNGGGEDQQTETDIIEISHHVHAYCGSVGSCSVSSCRVERSTGEVQAPAKTMKLICRQCRTSQFVLQLASVPPSNQRYFSTSCARASTMEASTCQGRVDMGHSYEACPSRRGQGMRWAVSSGGGRAV